MSLNNTNNTFDKSNGNVKFTDNSPKKITKKRILITCGIIALALLILFFVRSCGDGQSLASKFKLDVLKINTGSGFPEDIVGNTVAKNNSAYFDGCYAYISDTSFTVLNTTAGEEVSLQHSYASPAFKCASGKAITYDIGGYDYSVVSINGDSFNKKCENKIYCADISSNGVYGVVTSTSGYMSEASFYNSDGKFIYSYKMSEYYISALSIDSSGNYCAAAGVSTNGGKLISCVYILDFSKQEPVHKYVFENNTIFDIKYIDNNTVACIGDSEAYVINLRNDDYSVYSYSGKIITACTLTNKNGIVLSLSSSIDGKNCSLVRIDTSGNVAYETKTEYYITDVSSYSNTTFAYAKGNIYAYSPDGTQIHSCKCGNDTKSIVALSDKSVYTAGISQINCCNVN